MFSVVTAFHRWMVSMDGERACTPGHHGAGSCPKVSTVRSARETRKTARRKRAPARKRKRAAIAEAAPLPDLTNPRRAAFLSAYSQVGNVSAAARIAGCSRTQHYVWLHEDPEYETAFRVAHEEAVDLLEAEARRRAFEGVEEPVVYQGALSYLPLTRNGQVVLDKARQPVLSDTPLTIRRYSDTLLIFLLKGARPVKYAKFEGEPADPAATLLARRGELDLTKLTDDELAILRALREKAAAGPRRGAGPPRPPKD